MHFPKIFWEHAPRPPRRLAHALLFGQGVSNQAKSPKRFINLKILKDFKIFSKILKIFEIFSRFEIF